MSAITLFYSLSPKSDKTPQNEGEKVPDSGTELRFVPDSLIIIMEKYVGGGGAAASVLINSNPEAAGANDLKRYFEQIPRAKDKT